MPMTFSQKNKIKNVTIFFIFLFLNKCTLTKLVKSYKPKLCEWPDILHTNDSLCSYTSCMPQFVIHVDNTFGLCQKKRN